jgi:chaperonin GroEL (HSP60 family)
MESIPKILAENAGLTPLDIIADLRHSHCDGSGLWVGLDVFSRKIGNMMEKGVIEPVYMKEQTLKSAVEIASMILTVNKVIVKPRVLSPVEKVHGSPL